MDNIEITVFDEIKDYKEKIYDADFVTVNPYMGTDCVKPFIED